MPILCYHTVESGWTSSLSFEPDDFEDHCRWLATHRRVVPLDEAVALADRRFRLPPGIVALTFDDGFAGLREHALASLARHRLPATVFLVSETLRDPGRPVDWVAAVPPAPLRTLTLDEVREMQAAGIAFGSHSSVHADLTSLDPVDCERDLRTSRAVLEDLLRCPVSYLAYPRGLHDAGVRAAAERAGFTRAFSLPQGPEPTGPYAVPRAGVFGGNTLAQLRVKSSRWYPGLRRNAAMAAVQRRRHPSRSRSAA